MVKSLNNQKIKGKVFLLVNGFFYSEVGKGLREELLGSCVACDDDTDC